MAISNINLVAIGQVLQTRFNQGYTGMFARVSPMWDLFRKLRVADSGAKDIKFLYYTTPGYAAIAPQPLGSIATFPAGSASTQQENTAILKLHQATVEMSRQVIERAALGPAYVKPLEVEIDLKAMAFARVLAMELMGDGTGVLGEAAANAVDTTGAGGFATVSISQADTARGVAANFQEGDLVKVATQAGVAVTPTVTGTFFAYKVRIAPDIRGSIVQLQPVNAAGQPLALTASNIVATNVMYRQVQETVPNLTTIGNQDYSTLTEVLAGIESLSANDGRNVMGITMSGQQGGTRLDCGGNALSLTFFAQVLDDAERRTGAGAYQYKKAVTSAEVWEQLLEINETDRRLVSVGDHTRGQSELVYLHNSGDRSSSIKLCKDEFCKTRRVYIMPDSKTPEGKSALEYYGTDISTISAGGQNQFLRTSASGAGYSDALQLFMEQRAVVVPTRAAAIAVLTNMSVS
jgi:hypothetical protein